MTAILSVFHEHVAGWHTFTSPQMPGLFLTGPDEDFNALCDALPSTINALIEAEGRRPVSIQAAESYHNNVTEAAKADRQKVLHFMITSIERIAA